MFISQAADHGYNITSPAKPREKLIPQLLEESEKTVKIGLW
jgi:hypothetical protein